MGVPQQDSKQEIIFFGKTASPPPPRAVTGILEKNDNKRDNKEILSSQFFVDPPPPPEGSGQSSWSLGINQSPFGGAANDSNCMVQGHTEGIRCVHHHGGDRRHQLWETSSRVGTGRPPMNGGRKTGE